MLECNLDGSVEFVGGGRLLFAPRAQLRLLKLRRQLKGPEALAALALIVRAAQFV